MTPEELRAGFDRLAPKDPDSLYSVYAKNMKTGEVFSVNEDRQLPAASVIKMCVLLEVFKQAFEGKYSLDDIREVGNDTGGARGSGILKFFRMPVHLSVWNLATLMIIISDNTASNACIDLVGFDSVNSTLQALGCRGTVLRRYFIGAAVDDRSRDNLMTTGDYGMLLEKLYHGRLVSPQVSDGMLEIMKKQTLNTRIPLHLPEGTVVAHKTGTQPMTTHDSGIVYGPGGNDYVISIGVTGVPARPRGSDWVADVSKLVWDYFTGQ
jgi:beta-lactamase class A